MLHRSQKRSAWCLLVSVSLAILVFLVSATTIHAGESLYRQLSLIARGTGDVTLFNTLNTVSRNLDWSQAQEAEFEGNLRILRAETIEGTHDEMNLYLVRKTEGDLFILSMPTQEELLRAGEASPYFNLETMLQDKLRFRVEMIEDSINGIPYGFARFTDRPEQLLFDRIFKVSIVLMLFFVMAGMGLTLTLKDFQLVFQKPRGILIGAFLQWVVMPLIAVGIGHALGFYETFPFIFVGMVLIAASPGGVTSNLMTFYAEGDLALSISLTSFSTVLSLFFTPFLLALYCANVPEVTIPVALVVQTIIVLVIIPLALGMSVRARWSEFAKKATPFFSALGVIALLFLIGAGILSNLDKFADTERYGVTFYSMVIALTSVGMFVGALVPKILKINNYQTRAISLETGLRNASLAMAIALLIQDYMGDFYSSMFVTSAMFGLFMYGAGFISIRLYKKALPVAPEIPLDVNIEDEYVPD